MLPAPLIYSVVTVTCALTQTYMLLQIENLKCPYFLSAQSSVSEQSFVFFFQKFVSFFFNNSVPTYLQIRIFFQALCSQLSTDSNFLSSFVFLPIYRIEFSFKPCAPSYLQIRLFFQVFCSQLFIHSNFLPKFIPIYRLEFSFKRFVPSCPYVKQNQDNGSDDDTVIDNLVKGIHHN